MNKPAKITLISTLVAMTLPSVGHATSIHSITPAVADRGQLVTIQGSGFGAQNVKVTVGGDPVEIVAATGSRASFRVPLLGNVGDVVVEARNPGERIGRIGLNVRFDGNTVAVADTAAAVTAPVGSDGGTIAAAGMTLAIPAGAVPEGTTITATPLVTLQGSPFAGAPVGLKLEPSGLVLLQPATLTLPKPTGAGTVVGFGFNGDGEGFHLVPTAATGESVQLKVWHFSGAGTLTASLDELEAALSYEPTPAHELAEQRIAAALVDAQVNSSDPGPAISVALRNWRASSVSQGLQIAGTTTRLDFFELAFGEWLAWLAYLQEYRDTLAPADASFFDTATALDRDTATVSAAAVARRQLDRCIGPDLPRAALRDVLRVASAVNLGDLPIETTEPEPAGARPLPTGRNLPTACLDVVLLAVEHAVTLARNRDNRFVARAHVVFWSGDPSTSIPLRYRLADITDAPVPIASATTTSGTFATTVRPGALGVRTLELTVDLGADSVLSTFFDQQDSTVPVRDRLELRARRPSDTAFTDNVAAVAPGSGVLLRIRLAGDDVAGKTIVLTHDGNGTLPASTTANSSGEAVVTYTAPAAPGSELVTATVTDAGLTSGDAVVITTREPVVVTVTPFFGFVNAGQTLQFGAAVTGTADHRVSWVAGGGSISSSGLYTAGPTAGVFTVTAVSLADPTSSGSATVQVTGVDVTGLYLGERCFSAGPESCEGPGFQVSYQCNFTSFVGAGTVCGWFVGQDSSSVPNVAAARCQIETDGTRSGGAFTGRITSCAFGMTATQTGTRITGSISNGTLSFSVFADFDRDGSLELVERYNGIRVT